LDERARDADRERGRDREGGRDWEGGRDERERELREGERELRKRRISGTLTSTGINTGIPGMESASSRAKEKEKKDDA